ncbi:hypothetical protein NDN08_000460 [Rhodosorus marinus]|uniref:Pericentrin/AKAP-450 centrosomal targeting domain-containing protein n=1 Tax=Rhodosorus marinus TaxID=101924 RepID=A0AAV8UN80_9RHOD|nr:hypothetical protein NDN08_000460 [Rhodosorus marinus]
MMWGSFKQQAETARDNLTKIVNAASEEGGEERYPRGEESLDAKRSFQLSEDSETAESGMTLDVETLWAERNNALADRDDLEKTLGDILRDREAVIEERDSLEVALALARSQVRDLQGDKLEDDNDAADAERESLDENTSRIQDLLGDLRDLERELSDTQYERDMARTKLVDAEKSLRKYSGRQDSTNNGSIAKALSSVIPYGDGDRVEDLETELRLVRAQLDEQQRIEQLRVDADEMTEAKMRGLESMVAEVQDENERLRQGSGLSKSAEWTVDEERTKVAALEKEVSTLNSEMLRKETDIETLKAKLEQVEQLPQPTSESGIPEMRAARDDSDVEGSKTAVEESEISLLREELSRLSEQLSSRESEIEKLRKELERSGAVGEDVPPVSEGPSTSETVNSRHVELENERNSLLKDRENLSMECDKLRELIASFEDENAGVADDLKRISKELEVATSQAEDYKSSITSLREELASGNSAREELMLTLDQNKREMREDHEMEISLMEANISDLKATCARLEQADKDLETARGLPVTETAALEERENFKKLEAELAEVTNKLLTMEDDKQDLVERVKSLEKEVENKSGSIADMHHKLEISETALEDAEKEYASNQQASREDHEIELSMLNATILDLRSEMSKLGEADRVLKSARDADKQRVEEKQRELENSFKEREKKAQDRIDGLESELESLKTEYGSLQKQSQEAEEQAKESSGQKISMLTASVADLSTAASNLKDQVEEKDAELQKYKTSLQEMEENLKKTMEEKTKTASQLKETKIAAKKLHKKHQKVSALEEELRVTKDTLQTMQDEAKAESTEKSAETEKHISALEQSLSDSKSDMAKLEGEKGTLAIDLEEATREADELRKLATEREHRLEQLTNDVAKAEDDRAELLENVANLQERLKQDEESIAEYEQILDGKRSAEEELAGRVLHLENELALAIETSDKSTAAVEENTELKKRVREQEEALATLAAAKESLTRDLEQSKVYGKKLQRSRQKVSALESQLKTVKEDFERKEQEVVARESLAEVQETELSYLRAKLEGIENSLAERDRELNDSRLATSGAEEKLSALQTEKEEVVSRLAHEKSEMESQLNSARTRNDELTSEVEAKIAVVERVAEMELQLRALKLSKEELETDLSGKRTEIDVLRGFEAQVDELARVNKALAEDANEKAEALQKVTEFEARLEELEAQNELLQGDLKEKEALVGELRGFESKLLELEARNESLESDLNKKGDEAERAKSQEATVAEELAEVSSSLAELRAQNELLQSVLREKDAQLEKVIEDLSAARASTELEHQESVSLIQSLKKELEVLEQQIEPLREDLATMAKEKDELQLQYAEAREATVSTQEHLKSVEGLVAELEETIQRKDDEICELISSRDEAVTSLETEKARTVDNERLREIEATLETTRAQLTSEQDAFDAAKKDTESRIAELEAVLADADAERKEATAEQDSLRVKYAETEKQVHTLTDTNRELISENATLIEKIALMEDSDGETRELREELETLQEQASGMAEQVSRSSEVEVELSKLRDLLDQEIELRSKHEKSMEEMQEEMDGLLAQKDELESERKDLFERSQALEEEIAEASKASAGSIMLSSEEHEAQLRALREELKDAHAKELEEVTSRLEEREPEVSSRGFTSAGVAMSDEIDTLRKEKTEALKEISELKVELENWVTKAVEVGEEKRLLEIQKSTTVGDESTMQAKIHGLQEELDASTNRVKELLAKNEALEQRAELPVGQDFALADVINAPAVTSYVQKRVAEVEAKVGQSMQGSIRELEEQLQSALQEKRSIQERFSSYDKQLSSRFSAPGKIGESSASASDAEADALSEKLKAANQENSRLLQEVESLRARLDEKVTCAELTRMAMDSPVAIRAQRRIRVLYRSALELDWPNELANAQKKTTTYMRRMYTRVKEKYQAMAGTDKAI